MSTLATLFVCKLDRREFRPLFFMSAPDLNSLANIDSLNPFPQSKIYVGVGNTIVSMAFFGVGPSVVAYAFHKVLEDNEKV